VSPKFSVTATGHGNAPVTGDGRVLELAHVGGGEIAGVPCTPVQSGGWAWGLISITGSSRPAHFAAFSPTGASAGRSMMTVVVGNLQLGSDTSMPRLSTPRIFLTAA
jgi:hypothetical protein